MNKKKKGKAYKKKKSTMQSLLKPTAIQVYQQLCDFPIIQCLIMEEWQSSGLTHIVIARKQPDGRLAFADFLVDVLCLGVKNCFIHIKQTESDYKTNFLDRSVEIGNLVDCPVDLAHALIYGAVEFAASLGFAPHPDYERARLILEPQEKFETLPTVTFGENGKPCYVSGPYDDVDFVLETLRQNVGEGNFHFVTRGPDL